MFRKKYLLIILTIALVLASGLTALAQTTEPISGRVELANADGKTTPVEGALVEVFRVDLKTALMSDKTDKKGSFSFAGVAVGGNYVLSVSGTGLAPALSQNLKAGSMNNVILVKAGDGRRLTEDEVRTALANETKAGPVEMTPEEKKALEEFEKKKADVEGTNAAIAKALEDGVKAFNEKNYDLAIAKFDEGYNANTTFVGSAPVLLNNRGASLTARAVKNYNKMVTSKDPAEKTTLKPLVTKDFEDAMVSYGKSWEISSNAKPEEITNQKNYDESKVQSLTGAEDTVRLMVRTELIPESQKETVKTLMSAYVAFEADKAKKVNGQIILSNFFNKIFDFENAVIEWRKAVAIMPNNIDAVGGLGLALYTVTFGQADMAKKQESLNYLQYFLEIAPKDHPLVLGIGDAINDLKAQKLKPQKISVSN